MDKISFSGHESFICKQFWLRKIFDYTSTHRTFGDDLAVVELGVGKNMVASLRYWGRAFGTINENDKPTQIAEYIFGEAGQDVYLEDFATIWLLHYYLIKTNRFSAASLVFNEFRKDRIEFTKEQLANFLLRKAKEYESNTDNENSIDRDANVFIRMYSKPQRGENIEIEDDFTGVLIDLELIKRYKQRGLDGKLTEWYKIESEDRVGLPYQLVLFAILDNYAEQKSITFKELLVGRNSPGAVFALNADGLYHKLKQISENYKPATYTETAGNQVLQFKTLPNKFDILNDYYQQY
ncbi:DUF4007 family protein [Dyadobacter sandarakinus]|uniref:DUF4007 family protein n=1 Tax=Dyadobacter sandarakinus TaxID=2747268 RepID=A0ABX7I7N9_9BACT|nr:DUF4007 family protein [Dyadobacter sandarakinus]QRR01497.1 DUF4007 family protein [Dyadobacter sandarakinus]